MKPGIVFILFSILFWSGCDGLPLADTRTRPTPPALPAEELPVEPFVNLTASKMNVVYVGIPNPLNLQSIGVNLNDLEVWASPPGYITEHEKMYSLNMGTPGLQTVSVRQNRKLLNEFTFRAKPLPDPVAKLGNNPSGKMSVGEFKAQRGLAAMLENFDFEVRCFIAGFEITRIPLEAERVKATNKGGSYVGESQELIRNTAPGDVYTFTNVRAKCPGDKTGRKVNSLVFEIM